MSRNVLYSDKVTWPLYAAVVDKHSYRDPNTHSGFSTAPEKSDPATLYCTVYLIPQCVVHFIALLLQYVPTDACLHVSDPFAHLRVLFAN